MSTLKVNNLSSVDGSSDISLTTPLSGSYRTGEIIERIGGPCDGRTVTGLNGNYTLQDVTSVQLLTTSYVDVTGSSITYNPPAGTNNVHYEFSFQISAEDGTDSITASKFYIDGVEVVSARHNAGAYRAQVTSFNWVIECNAGAADTNTGRLTSWSGAKTLKIQARAYSTAFDARYHNVRYWEGTSNTTQVTRPNLIITAIA